jgi:hypothetical protein
MNKITLTKQEQYTCHKAALIRAENTPDYWDTRSGAYEAAESGLSLHEFIAQDAAATGSEWAVAKVLGYDFDPYLVKGKRIADVGKNIEVKSTKYLTGHLIIQEIDRTEDIAVLVLNKSPEYTVVGCLPIAWAKNERFRHKVQANWWIPQGNLMPIGTMPYPVIQIATAE